MSARSAKDARPAEETARRAKADGAARSAKGGLGAAALAELRFVRLGLRTSASPDRVYTAWSDPDRLRRWFPEEVRGSLAPGTRSTLVWPHRSVWWEVEEADPGRRFVFSWPWLAEDSYITRVTILIEPEGYGARLALEDGPFDLTIPGILEAWGDASAGWGQALAFLKAYVDNSVDLRH